MTYDVLTVIGINITLVKDMTSCCLVDRYQQLQDSSSYLFQLKSTLRHVPAESSYHSRHYKNLLDS